MSDWQTSINLKDIIEKLEDGTLDVSDGGKQIAERIKTQLVPEIKAKFPDELEGLEELAANFETIAKDDTAYFNRVMNDLYDWGDTRLDAKVGGKKLCWISVLI